MTSVHSSVAGIQLSTHDDPLIAVLADIYLREPFSLSVYPADYIPNGMAIKNGNDWILSDYDFGRLEKITNQQPSEAT